MPILSGAVPDVPEGLATLPDLDAVKDYLGDTSWSDADIQDALDEEYDLQVKACGDRSAAYPAPLAGALKRRVARNLAMRAVTLGFVGADTDTGPVRVGGLDAEIRRKEAPYRKLVTA